jgi:hypothetical protein
MTYLEAEVGTIRLYCKIWYNKLQWKNGFKLAADVGFQGNNACVSLYGQKHDEKYALYKVTCYTTPICCCFELY